MKPARQTSVTPRSFSARASARIEIVAAREQRGDRSTSGLDARRPRARSSPRGIRPVRDDDRDARVEPSFARSRRSAPADCCRGRRSARPAPASSRRQRRRPSPPRTDLADRARRPRSPAARQRVERPAARRRGAHAMIRPMPMLNVRSMSLVRHRSGPLQPLEDRGHAPRAAVDDGVQCPPAECAAGCR